MGSLEIGDYLIVTDVLGSELGINNGICIIGLSLKVEYIDTYLNTYQYKVEYNNRTYWVEGIPYSPLLAELL